VGQETDILTDLLFFFARRQVLPLPRQKMIYTNIYFVMALGQKRNVLAVSLKQSLMGTGMVFFYLCILLPMKLRILPITIIKLAYLAQ
jgi:hypothetical protein